MPPCVETGNDYAMRETSDSQGEAESEPNRIFNSMAI